MKRNIRICMAVLMLLALTACSDTTLPNDSEEPTDTSVADTATTDEVTVSLTESGTETKVETIPVTEAETEFVPGPLAFGFEAPGIGEPPTVEDAKKITYGMTWEEIVVILGKPQRDVGSGILIAQWDLADNHQFQLALTIHRTKQDGTYITFITAASTGRIFDYAYSTVNDDSTYRALWSDDIKWYGFPGWPSQNNP